MSKGIRRDPLDVLKAQEDEIAAKRKKLDDAAKESRDAIAILTEKRTNEENLFLGAVCRIVMANDHSLHRKLVDQAEAVIQGAKSPKQARSALLRVLGPLPVPQSQPVDAGKLSKPPIISEFARAGK